MEIMKLKFISKECGFSRIRPDKQNIILETPMEESAFRRLRKGLPKHLHSRLVYVGSSNAKTSTVVVRGLGVLSSEKQVEQLIDWLKTMIENIRNG